jgi:hypothetical protein
MYLLTQSFLSRAVRLLRLQQVLIVTCCATKRHHSFLPSIHPIQFLLNIITTSRHSHAYLHMYMYTQAQGSSKIPIPLIDPCTSHLQH